MDQTFPKKQLDKQKMVCKVCFFIYDQVYGDPESNIDPFTNFIDIPESWTCPICGAKKDQFEPLQLDI